MAAWRGARLLLLAVAVLQEWGHFVRVALAGAVSCSVTHSLVVPLDVIKTRMQLDEDLTTLAQGARAVWARSTGRWRGLAFVNGIGATAAGYWLQGAVKFGGYELFKHALAEAFPHREAGGREARLWRLPMLLGAAAAAEVCATAFLCPLEVIKVRMQTDPTAAMQGIFRTSAHILRHEGPQTLFKGFIPIAMRQVPYTMVKLVCFELVTGAVLAAAQRRKDGEALGPRARMAVTLGGGLVAGALAAAASQPADVLLTRICGSSSASSLTECVIAEGLVEQAQYLWSLGWRACFAGLAPRLCMVASMTAVQFFLYDVSRARLRCAGPPPRDDELPLAEETEMA